MTKGEARKLIEKQTRRLKWAFAFLIDGAICLFLTGILAAYFRWPIPALLLMGFCGAIFLALFLIIVTVVTYPYNNPDTRRICREYIYEGDSDEEVDELYMDFI